MKPNGEGPVEELYRGAMNGLAMMINEILNPDPEKKEHGFCIIMFPFGDVPEPRINFISNANRADMICGLKELIANLEGRGLESPKSKQ